MSTALIIFAKAPIPGEVKTRLCPPLDHDEAASLHGTLVLDAVERARGLPGASLYVAGAPDIAHPFFKVMEGRYGTKLLAQRGPDLGSRMKWAMQDAFDQGAQEVLLTGTDLPTLPRALLAQALTLVKNHEVVLGPTADGGYYLIGLRKMISALFDGIAWSTASVFADTKKKVESAGLSLGLLPECRDLDTLEDLKAFIGLCGKERAMTKRTEGALRLIAARLKER
ncbi:MAG TPA: TIGR04282 family arsenosugar biosynthesis glycosyltransferase [Nitrospirales bacterium]|nr:TIGR04282 family arsenosugar biosynthesis glycosyltransferase [Nitrospirales bacterium]